MNPQLIGLRFVLNYGGNIITIVPQAIALSLMEGWKHGQLPPILDSDTCQAPREHGIWAIKSDQILALHTVDLNQLQQPAAVQQQGAMPRPPQVPPMSGR